MWIVSLNNENEGALEDVVWISGIKEDCALDGLSKVGNDEETGMLPSTNPCAWLVSRLLFSEFPLDGPECEVGGLGLVAGQHGQGKPKWSNMQLNRFVEILFQWWIYKNNRSNRPMHEILFSLLNLFWN